MNVVQQVPILAPLKNFRQKQNKVQVSCPNLKNHHNSKKIQINNVKSTLYSLKMSAGKTSPPNDAWFESEVIKTILSFFIVCNVHTIFNYEMIKKTIFR